MENMLNEIYEAASSSVEALMQIAQKTEEAEFKRLIENNCDTYESIKSRIAEKIYGAGGEPKDLNPISKAFMWGGIEINTLNADTHKIAETLIDGAKMGIDAAKKINKTAENNTLIEEFERQCRFDIKAYADYL